MADELQEALGEKAKLIPGSGGVFEVTVDGNLVFSKKELDRFPEDGEIVSLING